MRYKMYIPQLVCAFFMQYLCQSKLGCLKEADDVLYELFLLLKHDDEYHIEINLKSISWHILGICQQMCGDERAACRSFMTAHQMSKTDVFKLATSVRLGTMLLKYFL